MDLELDKLAAEVFDYCQSNRKDNLGKNGTPGDPRKVSSEFSTMHEEVKTFYRNVVKWHLSKKD